MAYHNSLSGRMEELRFPAVRSPGDESAFANGNGAGRGDNPYFTSPADSRSNLQRRFTADSSKMSMNRSSFGGAAYPPVNAQQQPQKPTMEEIQAAKRNAQEQLRLLEMQERNLQMGASKEELETISSRLHRSSLTGPVSEPTTPPEYNDGVYSNRFSRSSRMSNNSIMSPPGLGKRTSGTSSIMSPGTTRLSGSMYNQAQKPSAKSVPGSRRGSDEEEDYAEELPNIRNTAGRDRYSMPVGSSRPQHRYSMAPATSRASYDIPINTSFLDETDNDHLSLNGLDLKSPIAKTFAQLEGGMDGFPTLTSNGHRLSANSAALDLAKSKTPDADWINGPSRYRPGHQSMPHNDSSMYRPVLSNISSPPPERPADLSRRKSQRHSMGVTFEEGPKTDQTPLPTSMSLTRPTALQTSYSTNDVPTVRKSLTLDNMATPPKSQGDQFHNHNVSLGRIPSHASNRQSREYSNSISSANPGSGLQASAAPFGPTYNATSDLGLMSPGGGYGSQAFGYNSQSFGINGQNGAQSGFGFGGYGKTQEVARSGSGRRNNYDETRFNSVPLESYRGRLYELCKDQHGCRYLQRKLEDGDADAIQIIFSETCPHIVELMTDPFGNYLCQKLFEHCDQVQRSTLIHTASPALPIIAHNQHGTRALQKMIEYVQTDEQVDMIIHSLSHAVVELVQDLNGNHVIQKCLTRLGAERSQFIYDAVASECVIVGTHRHGCCVLQRCIDHAQGAQRAQLIARITRCAFDLVQDPFGNYVVQYILDLNERGFTTPLCENFGGRVVALSKQKFSSNVIEKCLRTADDETKRLLVDEMLIGNELEKMLRDSFANYVVQTALEHADLQSRERLTDAIRPILPSIKSTPHGRRIAGKIIGANDPQPGRYNGPTGGPEPFANGNMSTGRAGGRRQIQIVGGGFNGPRYGGSNGFENGNAMDNGFTNGNGYAHGAYGNEVNEPAVNMFAPQPFGGSTGFGGFHNGQVGNGFI